MHACPCMCVNVHVHVYGETPYVPIHPHHLAPRAAGSPNHQNSISPELSKIIWFYLKILYLWTLLNSYRLMLVTPDTPHQPALPSRAKETQVRKNTISHEWIEIIGDNSIWRFGTPEPFCAYIGLALVCRLGVSYPKWHFYVLDPKHTSFSLLWQSDKKFSCFCTDPIRPYLDWALRGFLISKPIYNPFKFNLKWGPKCKIQLKYQFAINHKKLVQFDSQSKTLESWVPHFWHFQKGLKCTCYWDIASRSAHRCAPRVLCLTFFGFLSMSLLDCLLGHYVPIEQILKKFRNFCSNGYFEFWPQKIAERCKIMFSRTFFFGWPVPDLCPTE